MVTNDGFRRTGALGAFVLAASSVLYAVAFLIITPPEQREGDIPRFFESFKDDSTGRQLANIFFITGGLAGSFAVVALADRLRHVSTSWARWLAMTGVFGNLAGMTYGVWNIARLNELAELWDTPAYQPAVEVVFRQPPPVDPLGQFRFAGGDVAALLFGLMILRARDLPDALGWLGGALGVDTLVLFAMSLLDVGPAVLVTGGLASLILLPVFWVWVGLVLWRAGPDENESAPVGR